MCKGMLNRVLYSTFQRLRHCNIPILVVWNNSSCVLIMPILWSDKAHFRTRYGAFRLLKWA